MIKLLLRFFFFFLLLLFAQINVFGQPNNFQCTPNHIGMLPNAAPCLSSGGFNYGNIVTVSGTNANATNDSLSGSITTCYPSSSAPLHDVWYEFTASETHVEINIQGIGTNPLTNPYVAIYESVNNQCIGIMPRSCYSGTGSGTQLIEFGPLTYGIKYFLQIASTTTTGNGAFTFDIRSKNSCSDCLKNSVLQAFPLPVQGAYPPDTTVTFCYSVGGYNEQFGNRFHGIVPLFGNGWDASTFSVTQNATSADGQGQWKWLNNINVNGNVVSGFFYDIGNDNNPTNNLGDQGGFTHLWNFCFKIKTQTQSFCNTSSDDLSIKFINYSDGESGNLVTTQDCSGDLDYVFNAHMNCCSKPLGAYPTAAYCNNISNGQIDVYCGYSLSGYHVKLFNEQGMLIDNAIVSAINQNHYIKTGLLVGNYYLLINENSTSACQTSLNIYVPGPVVYYANQSVFACGTNCANAAQITIVSGTVQNGISWNGAPPSGPTGSNLCFGWNHYAINVSASCTIVDSIFINNLPFANPQFSYSQSAYCTSDSFAVLSNFPATASGTFSVVQNNTGILPNAFNQTTGRINLTGATSSGTLIIKYSLTSPCAGFSVDTIMVEVSPFAPNIYLNQTLCTGDPNPVFTNSLSNCIQWYLDASLTNLDTTQVTGESYSPFGNTFPLPGIYTYYLTQVNSAVSGCGSSPQVLTINVSTNGDCGLVIYKGITPNGDNHNDFWQIDGISNDTKNTVSIFNRWGEKIWETIGYDNESNRWEGKDSSGNNLVDGTYFYVINYKDSTKKGWVELTR